MCPMVRRPPGMALALLGFLQNGPQHGYQIHRMLSDPAALGLIWKVKQSQLYALLSRLEKDGYVIGTFQNQDPHPPRRVIELTEFGREGFSRWLTEPVKAPYLVRQEFMAKMYFAQKESAEKVQLLVENQRAVCTQWVDKLTEQAKTSELASFRWNMYQYRLGQIAALRNWLESLSRL
ncbi:MAG: PadR family transcriptional regulator [Chloroflexota bacterium]